MGLLIYLGGLYIVFFVYVEDNEAEMEEMMRSMDRVKLDVATFHDIEWKVRKREDEINDLKTALSNAHVQVNDEREQVLRLYAENDALKLQEMEDRARIRDLMALSKPIEQDITYYRDARPNRITRFPPTTGPRTANPDPANPPRAKSGSNNGGGGGGRKDVVFEADGTLRLPQKRATTVHRVPGSAEHVGGADNRVLRTIFLPNAKNDQMILTIESLKTQLEETTKLAEERAATLIDDRRQRMDEERARREVDARTIAELQATVKSTRDLLANTTKEDMRRRLETAKGVRELTEENQSLRVRVAALTDQLRSSKASATAIKTDQARRVREEAENVAEHFRKQATEKEEALAQAKLHASAASRSAASTIRRLEEQLKVTKRRQGNADRQRRSEREGFTSEMSTLKASVRERDSTIALLRSELDVCKSVMAKSGISLAGISVGSRMSGGSQVTRGSIPGVRGGRDGSGGPKSMDPTLNAELELMNEALKTGDRASRMYGDIRGMKHKISELEGRLLRLPY